MTLKELLLSCDIKRIIHYVMKYDPKQLGMEPYYKQAYDILCQMESVESTQTINIEWYCTEYEEEPYIRVSSCTGDFWENCLGKEVVRGKNIECSNEELAAYCLWEMTYFGFSPGDTSYFGNIEPLNIYGERAKALSKRRYNNYLPKKYKKYWDRNAYPMEILDYLHKRENKRSRSKRMRDYRQDKRIEQLLRNEKIENLIQKLTTSSTMSDRKNLDFLFQTKSIFESSYHSHSYNKEQRLPYLKELLQDYEKGDFSEYTTFIFMLRVAPEYPLSECEKIYFSEIIKIFPTEANVLQGIGFDETLGEEATILRAAIK